MRVTLVLALAFALYGLLTAACIVIGAGTRCRIPWRWLQPATVATLSDPAALRVSDPGG